MVKIQHAQLQHTPNGILVVEVKGNFTRDFLCKNLSRALMDGTTVLEHYHMEFGRADYVSEHDASVLARCDAEACARLKLRGVAPAHEGVWANWARLYPIRRERRMAARLQRCRNGGAASHTQTRTVKSFLITQFFDKISEEERLRLTAG